MLLIHKLNYLIFESGVERHFCLTMWCKLEELLTTEKKETHGVDSSETATGSFKETNKEKKTVGKWFDKTISTQDPLTNLFDISVFSLTKD